MKKYVAYYRVSTKQQGTSGLGLEAQRNAVSSYIRNGELLHEFTEIESGRKTNRTELTEAIAMTRKEGATLIIAKLDRLSRNASFTFMLMDSGVRFIAADIPEANDITIGIMAVLAQEEAKKISERTKSALAVKKTILAREGKKLGTPKNLTQASRDQSLFVRSSIAKDNGNNKRAYAMVMALEGKSLSYIAKCLNDGGFKTSRGSDFSSEQVRRISLLYHE